MIEQQGLGLRKTRLYFNKGKKKWLGNLAESQEANLK